MVEAHNPIFSLKKILNCKGYSVLKGFIQGPDFKKKVLEFAQQLGTPSTRDGGVAIWDVRARNPFGTFSETSNEADFHTDAQYRDDPESAFILACETPASCGGESFLLTKQDVRIELSKAKWPNDELALLSKPVWRWQIPDVFVRTGDPAISTPKAVISDEQGLNWRFNNLVFDSEAQRLVAIKFRNLLRNSNRIIRFKLNTGDVLVCCNKTVLHGRSSFEGCARQLYRVRLI